MSTETTDTEDEQGEEMLLDREEYVKMGSAAVTAVRNS